MRKAVKIFNSKYRFQKSMQKSLSIWMFFCLILAGILSCGFPDRKQKLNSKENRKNYSIKVGETFDLYLVLNPSTGVSECWLNRSAAKSVTLIARHYIPYDSKLIGGGGVETITFMGRTVGSDSILFAKCPTGVSGRSCESFSDGSVKPENVFIVDVKE